jgi:hypothetical protein
MSWRTHPFDIIGRRASVVVLAAALGLCASPALAQDAPAFDQEVVTPDPETPWYEAFTLSMNEASHPVLGEPETFDWEAAGGRWGITLGIEDHSDTRFDREDVSAGAFVNLGERFRLGGEVRFAAPDSEYFTLRGETETGRRQPEIKFESALRF